MWQKIGFRPLLFNWWPPGHSLTAGDFCQRVMFFYFICLYIYVYIFKKAFSITSAWLHRKCWDSQSIVFNLYWYFPYGPNFFIIRENHTNYMNSSSPTFGSWYLHRAFVKFHFYFPLIRHDAGHSWLLLILCDLGWKRIPPHGPYRNPSLLGRQICQRPGRQLRTAVGQSSSLGSLL